MGYILFNTLQEAQDAINAENIRLGFPDENTTTVAEATQAGSKYFIELAYYHTHFPGFERLTKEEAEQAGAAFPAPPL